MYNILEKNKIKIQKKTKNHIISGLTFQQIKKNSNNQPIIHI